MTVALHHTSTARDDAPASAARQLARHRRWRCGTPSPAGWATRFRSSASTTAGTAARPCRPAPTRSTTSARRRSRCSTAWASTASPTAGSRSAAWSACGSPPTRPSASTGSSLLLHVGAPRRPRGVGRARGDGAARRLAPRRSPTPSSARWLTPPLRRRPPRGRRRAARDARRPARPRATPPAAARSSAWTCAPTCARSARRRWSIAGARRPGDRRPSTPRAIAAGIAGARLVLLDPRGAPRQRRAGRGRGGPDPRAPGATA